MECKIVDKINNEKKAYTSKSISYINGHYSILNLKNALNAMLYDDLSSAVDTFIEIYFPTKKDIIFSSAKTFCIQSLVLLELILNERNLLNDNAYSILCEAWKNIDYFSDTESIKKWFEKILKTILPLVRETSEATYGKIIRSINEIIEKNYANIKNIGEIASQLFISESYARKIYKQHTGKTIFEKLFVTKMEHAIHLIVDRKMPAQQVYLMVGYRSKTAFLDAFKRYTGYLPSEYMENIRSIGKND